MNPIEPAARAVGQIDDPVFLGVVLRSIILAVAAFAALAWAVARGLHALFGLNGWIAGLTGGVGGALAALYLFLPVAGIIATLFVDRIAAAVERRCYPQLPPARPAPLAAQLWDGLVLGVRVLFVQIAALLLAPFLLGITVPLSWVIAAWAIGRGLFVAVAMRRMSRADAIAAYESLRSQVIIQGLLIAVASLVPFLNLLVPVLGVAAMVHVLHRGNGTLSLAAPVC